MLLRHDVLQGIESGRISVVYRKWSRPWVRPGSHLRTAIGVLEVIGIDEVEPTGLDVDDATAAGLDSVDALLASAGDRGEILYRITLRLVGEDPRVALRSTIPDRDEQNAIVERLDRLDRSSTHGPWTRDTLRLIRDHPGVRAEDLARSVGREKHPFKLDVRKLKELGLTESLQIGYRLSPRGQAVLSAEE
jgi:hypothetical protein